MDFFALRASFPQECSVTLRNTIQAITSAVHVLFIHNAKGAGFKDVSIQNRSRYMHPITDPNHRRQTRPPHYAPTSPCIRFARIPCVCCCFFLDISIHSASSTHTCCPSFDYVDQVSWFIESHHYFIEIHREISLRNGTGFYPRFVFPPVCPPNALAVLFLMDLLLQAHHTCRKVLFHCKAPSKP